MEQRHDFRRLVRCLPWAALVVCSVNPAKTDLRADSIVIPAVYSDTEAPALMAEGQDFPWRQHYLYYDFEFPSGPIDITGFRYRPKAYTGTYSVEYRDTQISLTTTRETSLSNFDSNLDAALQSLTTVLDGDILVQTTREQPPLNPKSFDYEFLWETPFRYDPADGVNLLIEFESGGYDQAPLLDAAKIVSLPEPQRDFRRRHFVEYFGCSTGCYWPEFPVTEFIYTPVLPPPGGSGDFNADGVLDASDIDALTAAVRGGSHPTEFDLNSDNVVDQSDRLFWVNESKRTYFGDANLDGEFNSGDLIAVFQAGQYEDAVAGNSTWSTGDWDGDGEFESADLIAAFSEGAYEAGPRAAVSAVPEPASRVILLVGFIGIAIRRRYLGP